MGDHELWFRAVRSRDARFDGWFFVAVTSTGIYCRPSCASTPARREHLRYFPTAAAAQRSGFRACKRCRPDASPGSPEWNRRGDVVARAMRDLADGVVDRDGVAGLASHLGYSTRQLNRLLVAEVGAGALELARAQRAQTARLLLETTELRAAEVAFAAGFGSVRQFNATVRAVFDEPPLSLRARARRPTAAPAPAGTLTLRLAFRRPYAATPLFSFLARRAVPGVEAGDSSRYRRSLALPHGPAVAEVLAPRGDEPFLTARLQLSDLRDLTTAMARLRHLFDADADPEAVAEVLSADPLVASSVVALAGLRVPGHVDGSELAVRALLGQQVSVAGARTLAGRLAAAHGEPLPERFGAETGPVRLFPSAEAIAELPPAAFAVPSGRGRAIVSLAAAVAGGEVDLRPGADREVVSARLLAIPGIGPWTVAYIRMRALSDPDAYLPSDLGVRRALERLGRRADPRSSLALAERWRPYRAYGVQHLWAASLEAGRPEDKEDVA